MVEADCPLCKKALESTSHALFYCDKLWEVWWNWHDCPINLLAGTMCLVDLALKILDAGSPGDLETLLPLRGPFGLIRIKWFMKLNAAPTLRFGILRCVLRRTIRMPYCIIMLSS